MGIRSLVSFGLLAIPVAVTVGVLVGLDAYRTSTGQGRLFVDNSIKSTLYCQKAYGITPDSNGLHYTLNPNQWGWTQGDPGNLCMNVTVFNNGTYATNTSAPEFAVTWQYPQGPPTQPVHAFPNIQADANDVLPLAIDNIGNVDVDLHWTYGVGDQAADATDLDAVTTAELNANVAIDMFLDADSTKAQSTTDAAYEVMVWLAAFGSATQPIGLDQGAVTSQVINGTTFNLYYGQNGFNQNVLTWQAAATQEVFIGDITPLLTSLSSIPSIQAPSGSDYLGYIGLGSETLWSSTNVTFSVPRLSMHVLKQ